jgi:hypothetical protein
MDEGIGQVLDALRAAGAEENKQFALDVVNWLARAD